MRSKETIPPPSFGSLLKRYRQAAGLTQEELAERAAMSARGVKYLEAGTRQPYPDTVRRLAAALSLPPAEEAAFEAAARVSGAPKVAALPRTSRHNLPLQTTSFIGRERERDQVLALLDHAPLVTLTGAGGAGKTRLALTVAADLLDAYADGVWLVELAALTDPRLVERAVVAALELREELDRPLVSTLIDHLKERRVLLLLDNCEHLIDACAALVTALLRACPWLRILTTSRVGLAVAGESLYRVPSLSVPDPRHLPPLELVPAYEAVRLFVERAQARQTGFGLSGQNAALVARICAQLDGIPLAIELAAARVGSLPLEAVAARLDQSLRLLTGGARTALPRQQRLRATLDWSWELLGEPERLLLRRLSVFAGGWTLSAAEAACAGAGIDAYDVADLLASLVDKSLALLEEREGSEARYRLLELTRQYAAERLMEAGENAALRERHLDWCLALAREAEPWLRGPEQARWLDRLETEHDNLRAGLGWSVVEESAVPRGTALAALVAPFWAGRGHYTEGRAWLERLLAYTTATPLVRAHALRGLGALAFLQGDHARAVASYSECLALFEDLSDWHGCAVALLGLGGVARLSGNYAQARPYLERSLDLSRELGDCRGCADALRGLGVLAGLEGDYARAQAYFEEGLPLIRELDDRREWATAVLGLGDVACLQGDYARAKARYEEGLAVNQELGNRQGWAIAMLGLGLVTYLEGDYARARAYYGDCLALSRELGVRATCANALLGLGHVVCLQGDQLQARAYVGESLLLYQALAMQLGIAEGLELGARISAAQREYRRATVLFAAASGLRGTVAAPLSSYDRDWYEQVVAAARTGLDPEQFAVAWADGQALPLDDAIALALESDRSE